MRRTCHNVGGHSPSPAEQPATTTHQGKTPKCWGGRWDQVSFPPPRHFPGKSQDRIPGGEGPLSQTQQMLFPRGGIQGVPNTTSAIMESQIKKIKSHASGHRLMSTRVREESPSPHTAVHNWVSALPGGTSP